MNLSHNVVVQKHDGQIGVSSTQGKTCFQVRLPLEPPVMLATPNEDETTP